MPVPADIIPDYRSASHPGIQPLRPGFPAPGFTLLEVMLAMAILVVLVAGLAGITGASIRLGRSVLEAQQEDAVRDGFERLIRENLAEIPQDSPLLLQTGTSSGQQTVILGRAAGLFPVSGLPLVTESVALETRRERSGQFALWLLYYAGDLAKAMEDNAVENELLVQIPFKDGLDLLQWQAYDPTTDEWKTEWDESGRRPHYLEMVYRFAGDAADHRTVFWFPRLQTNIGGGGQGVGPGGGNPSPDAGGNPDQPGGPDGRPDLRPGGGRPGNGGGRPGGGRPGGGGGGPGIRVEVPR